MHLVLVPRDVPKMDLSKVFQLLIGSVSEALSKGLERMRRVTQLRRARQLGEASCFTSAGRVTRVGETTFSHVNGLARPPGTRQVRAFFTAMRFRFALPTNIHCVSMWPELSRIPVGFSSARAAL